MEANNLAPQYTDAFEFLTKWIPVLNSTFEPESNGSIKRQKSDFSLSHPIVLRTWDNVRKAIIEENNDLRSGTI